MQQYLEVASKEMTKTHIFHWFILLIGEILTYVFPSTQDAETGGPRVQIESLLHTVLGQPDVQRETLT